MKLPYQSMQHKRFTDKGNSEGMWLLSAQSLISSARVLLRQYKTINFDSIPIGETVPEEAQVLPSVALLYGFAVECLFKALWLRQGKLLVVNGKYKSPNGVNDHNLYELADVTRFQLSPQERKVLIRLSRILTSTGRYPISKNFNDERIVRDDKGGFGPPNSIHSGDFNIVEDIIERICMMSTPNVVTETQL